ncbi:MAG: hypothetical protein ACLUVC_05410 [Longibaculum sp.]
MKDNKAECVLISPKKYTKLIDQLNDAKLLIQTTEKMNPEEILTQQEFDEKYKITDLNLEGYEEVEVE